MSERNEKFGVKVENNLGWSSEIGGGWKNKKFEDWGRHWERGLSTSVQCWFAEECLEKLGVKCIEDEVLNDSRRNLGMILLFISLLSHLCTVLISSPEWISWIQKYFKPTLKEFCSQSS